LTIIDFLWTNICKEYNIDSFDSFRSFFANGLETKCMFRTEREEKKRESVDFEFCQLINISK